MRIEAAMSNANASDPHDLNRFVAQQQGVDLVGARQAGAVDAIERPQVLVVERGPRLPAGLADIVQPVVEAMIAERRGIDGCQLLRLAQVALSQRFELLVRSRRRRRWWRRGCRRWRCGRARGKQHGCNPRQDSLSHRIALEKNGRRADEARSYQIKSRAAHHPGDP